MSILATCSEQARVITSSLAAVVMASLLASCASAPTFSRTVYEDPTILVRLDSPVVQEEVSGEPRGEIAELTPGNLAELLQSVRIQPEISFLSYWVLRQELQPETAFPKDEAQLLAPEPHWPKPGPTKRRFFSSGGSARMAFPLSQPEVCSSMAINFLSCWRMPGDPPPRPRSAWKESVWSPDRRYVGT